MSCVFKVSFPNGKLGAQICLNRDPNHDVTFVKSVSLKHTIVYVAFIRKLVPNSSGSPPPPRDDQFYLFYWCDIRIISLVKYAFNYEIALHCPPKCIPYKLLAYLQISKF